MERIRDLDPVETQEWLDSLDGVLDVEGPERAHFLIEQVVEGSGQATADVVVGRRRLDGIGMQHGSSARAAGAARRVLLGAGDPELADLGRAGRGGLEREQLRRVDRHGTISSFMRRPPSCS